MAKAKSAPRRRPSKRGQPAKRRLAPRAKGNSNRGPGQKLKKVGRWLNRQLSA